MPQLSETFRDVFDSGGWGAAIGVIGVWAWRALVGAHKFGRIEQKLDDHVKRAEAALAALHTRLDAQDNQRQAQFSDLTRRIDALHDR